MKVAAVKQQSRQLRIASLLPSTTDIIDSLGLSKYLVGVTHECDIPAYFSNTNSHPPFLLTESRIDIDKDSQYEIDNKVKEAAKEANKVLECSLTNHNALSSISLYPVNINNLSKAKPNIVLTQDLCGVCAPSTNEVKNAIQNIINNTDNTSNVNSTSKSSPNKTSTTTTVTVGNNNVDDDITILSLEPQSLEDVSDTFVTIANACQIPERGEELKHQFHENLKLLNTTIFKDTTNTDTTLPKVLVLEWLDPPYNGGHWIPDMVEAAGCTFVTTTTKTTTSNTSNSASSSSAVWNTRKSKQITWDGIYNCDADVILVACCGFDLQRNISDTLLYKEQFLKTRAGREGRIYATDGNQYFARPGPKLINGTTIIAQCAYLNHTAASKNITKDVGGLNFAVKENVGWQRINFNADTTNCSSSSTTTITDIEDCTNDFTIPHKEACDQGKMNYIDPKTGYHVFTELAHKKRGKCCGSGCRHCPFNHENVSNDLKGLKIMQPAFLYTTDNNDTTSRTTDNKKIKLLFFSGGKDSFLTLRALIRQQQQQEQPSFDIMLLTTFDATTRIIAHQEIHIDIVTKQAKHLQIPLIGVPIHRGTSERYVDRINKALDMLLSTVSTKKDTDNKLQLSLVFGDLHLEHVRYWRDDELSSFLKLPPGNDDVKIELEYPIWKTPYAELLNDLETSKVPCVISAVDNVNVNVDDDNDENNNKINNFVNVGDIFNRELYTKLTSSPATTEMNNKKVDCFGENGEFHTVVEVWKVGRAEALCLVE